MIGFNDSAGRRSKHPGFAKAPVVVLTTSHSHPADGRGHTELLLLIPAVTRTK